MYRFFGQIDGTIMDSLVQDRIYRRVALVDYQGACSDQNSPYSAAPVGTQPAALVSMFVGNLIKFGAAWLALMPHRVIGWPSYGEQEDLDDPTYAEDYDDEGSNVNQYEDSRDIPLIPPVSISVRVILSAYL